jgi:hypothetical protein
MKGVVVTPIKRFTRGKGFFEPFLARLRAKKANRLITKDLRGGRILDIGCGTFPLIACQNRKGSLGLIGSPLILIVSLFFPLKMTISQW